MRLLSLLASLSSLSASVPQWDVAPPPVSPSSQEAAALLAGETVVRQDTARGGSRGVAMAFVSASPEQVWAVVLDFDRYVEFLPYVTASTAVAGGAELELTTKAVVTRYKQTVADHHAEGYVTFELRPVGWSPMRCSTGWWRVTRWEGGSLLMYSVDVATAWYLPKETHDKAAAIGLPKMVTLMAERAEKTASR